MLQGMRNASQGLVGKIVLFVLFGLLIVSFAIWGIGDMIQGGGRNTVARVGKTDITMDQLRTAWQNELQRLSQQYRTVITPAQAREMGLDAIVLGRLVTEAALDQEADRLKLGVADAFVVQSIAENPEFRGANGQFDRARFADMLRNNGLSEAAYVSSLRSAQLRRQIMEGLAGAVQTPEAMREAVYRVNAERRKAAFITLSAASVTDVPAPTDEQLKTFHEGSRSAFRAPERRAMNVIALTPEALARAKNYAADVTDDQITARYDEVKDSVYGSPERRRLQQVPFPDEATARAALESIRAGKSFEDVARERGVSASDLELGDITRDQVFDPAVRDAAFALAPGAVSEPVKGNFGVFLVRAAAVTPAAVKPLAEVRDAIRDELARTRARAEIQELHDRIEDMRLNAQPLPAIASELGLGLSKIDAVDATGADASGAPSAQLAGLPGASELLKEAFQTDIGADNEALEADDGYVWYEVTHIDPARDRTLEEARPEVEKMWRENEVANRLAARAKEIVEKVDAGETLHAASGEAPQVADGLQRGQAAGALDAEVVRQIFSVPAGKAGSAKKGQDLVVFKVESAVMPAYSASAIPDQLARQMNLALADDLLTGYVRVLQERFGVSVNQQNLRNAIGSAQQ